MRKYILIILISGITAMESSHDLARVMMRLNTPKNPPKARRRKKAPLLPQPIRQTTVEKVPKEFFYQSRYVFSCGMCMARFINDEALQYHFWTAHIEQPITQCSLCKKTFTWSFEITKHEKEVHPTKKKYEMQIIAPKVNGQ